MALKELHPNAIAQFNLGYMYDQGEGVPQDYKLAVEWHRKAAEQGNAMGVVLLGTPCIPLKSAR